MELDSFKDIDRIIENHKKQITLYEEMKQSLLIEDFLKKNKNKGKLFSCKRDNLKLYFLKKDNSKTLTIAISEVIFEAYKRGWKVSSDWNDLKSYISKNNISFEGCKLLTKYENDILDNITLITIIEGKNE